MKTVEPIRPIASIFTKRRIRKQLLTIGIIWCMLGIMGCDTPQKEYSKQIDTVSQQANNETIQDESTEYTLTNIPEFTAAAYVELNHNEPQFEDALKTTSSFESYGELDDLLRCTSALANIGADIMPIEERGSIGSVKPSGWQTIKYDEVEGKYLYNRCHLIGYQLTGENANEENLITGTRFMNVEGMLPFENMVADYIKETNHHVLYRVTPVYEGDNLVAKGVTMEAYSVEDQGQGISFHVFVYNNQPQITIDYATGESKLSTEDEVVKEEVLEEVPVETQVDSQDVSQAKSYVLNVNNQKFHRLDCSSVAQIKAENKEEIFILREELLAQGYEPCKNCNP